MLLVVLPAIVPLFVIVPVASNVRIVVAADCGEIIALATRVKSPTTEMVTLLLTSEFEIAVAVLSERMKDSGSSNQSPIFPNRAEVLMSAVLLTLSSRVELVSIAPPLPP